MLALELPRRRGHGVLIERPRIVQRPPVLERRQHASAINSVAIRFPLRQPARVKIRAHFFGGDDANRRRQQRVQRALEFQRRKPRARPEMRHLPERVHSRIGAAGSLDDYFFLRDLARRVVQRALNGRHARLRLPAVEVRSIVGNGQLDVAHGCWDYRTAQGGRQC